MTRKKLIIMYDNLNTLISKGEIKRRYYNPCNYFDEIHFLLINQKYVNKDKVKFLIGDAKVFFNFIEINLFHKILCLLNLIKISPYLKKKFDKICAKRISIVRCYNLNYPIFFAEYLFKKFSLPYVISIHFDFQNYLDNLTFLNRFKFFLLKFRLVSVLKNAKILLPVYRSATRYLKQNKIRNFKICYNFVTFFKNKIKKKKNKEFKLVCTNRQFQYKNPINIIKAVAEIPNTKLTLVGDGKYHKKLYLYVIKKNLCNKVIFIKKINNEAYLKNLNKFDVFISNTYINEFSKGMIESISQGLPIIVNKENKHVPELDHSFCIRNEDTKLGYKNSIKKIISNKNLYSSLSKNALRNYFKKYETNACEAKHKNIYKKIFNDLNV